MPNLKCRFCNTSYATSGWRDRHERIKHKEMYLQCLETELSDVEGPPPAVLTSEILDSEDPGIAGRVIHIRRSSPLEDHENLTQARQERYSEAGLEQGEDNEFISKICSNPYTPFKNPTDYRLARWFIDAKTPKQKIDDWFRIGLQMSDTLSFSSGHTLYKQLNVMAEGLNLEFESAILDWGIDGIEPGEYFYRNPLQCIEHLLRQPAYADSLTYAPVREYNSEGHRVYSEIHTADWWWDTQVIGIAELSGKEFSV